MNYLLERKIKINRDPKYKSPNGWCLNEFDDKEELIGSDWIPFNWSLAFTLTSLKLATHLHVNKKADATTLETSSSPSGESGTYIERTILGRFCSGVCNETGNLVKVDQFSIFGTARSIKEFNVAISEVSADNEEVCWFTVIPSYESEGYDFNKVIEKDFAGFSVYLNSAKFNELTRLIESHSIDSASLSMSNVEGAYSQDYPTISRHYEIKLLTDGNAIEGVEKSKFEGTTVSKVGSFNIDFSSFAPLSTKHNVPSIDLTGELKADTDMETQNILRTGDNVNKPNLSPIAEVVKDLKIPLWCIFVALIFLLIK